MPGPSSGRSPPTEPIASTRSQPASARAPHVGHMVDPVRKDVRTGAVSLEETASGSETSSPRRTLPPQTASRATLRAVVGDQGRRGQQPGRGGHDRQRGRDRRRVQAREGETGPAAAAGRLPPTRRASREPPRRVEAKRPAGSAPVPQRGWGREPRAARQRRRRRTPKTTSNPPSTSLGKCQTRTRTERADPDHVGRAAAATTHSPSRGCDQHGGQSRSTSTRSRGRSGRPPGRAPRRPKRGWTRGCARTTLRICVVTLAPSPAPPRRAPAAAARAPIRTRTPRRAGTSMGNGSARWVNRCATGSAHGPRRVGEPMERGRIEARRSAHAVGESEQRHEGDRARHGLRAGAIWRWYACGNRSGRR